MVLQVLPDRQPSSVPTPDRNSNAGEWIAPALTITSPRVDLFAVRRAHAGRTPPVERDAFDERVPADREIGPGTSGFEVRVVRRDAVTVAQRQCAAADTRGVGGVVVVARRENRDRRSQCATRASNGGNAATAVGRAGSGHPCRAARRRRSRRRLRRAGTRRASRASPSPRSPARSPSARSRRQCRGSHPSR